MALLLLAMWALAGDSATQTLTISVEVVYPDPAPEVEPEEAAPEETDTAQE